MDSPRFNSGFSTIIKDEKVNQQKVKQCTRVVFSCVLNIPGVAATFKPGLVKIWITRLFQYFCLESSLGLTNCLNTPCLNVSMLIDELCQVSRINGILIYLNICIPVEAKSCPLDAVIYGN